MSTISNDITSVMMDGLFVCTHSQRSMLSLAIGVVLSAMFFFGIFTILAIFAVCNVLSSWNFTRGNICKAALTLTMYAVSTAHIATLLSLYDRNPDALSVAAVLNDSAALSHPQDSRLVVVALYLPIVNYILSDAVVVWRAWLLCSRTRFVLYIPVAFLAISIVAAIVVAAYDIKTVIFSTNLSEKVRSFGGVDKGDVVVYVLSATTNIWSTVMVAVKAWIYRKNSGTLMDQTHKTSQAGKLMALLVESGAMYSLVWVIFLSVMSVSGAGFLIMAGIMPQIVGIYPTALIVLVSFGRTHPGDRNVARHEPLIRPRRKHGVLDVSPYGVGPIHGRHEEQKLSVNGGGRSSDLESGEVRVDLRSFDPEAIDTVTVGELVESQ